MAGKRANGDGTFRKRLDGRWEGRAAVRVGNRLIRRSVYATTNNECRQLLRAAIRQLQRGVIPDDQRITVADFLTNWLTTINPQLRPTTRQSYRAAVDHVTQELGSIKLVSLSPQDVDALLRRKAEQGLSSRTLTQYPRRAPLCTQSGDALANG